MLKLKSLSLSIIVASVVFGSQALASVPAPIVDRFTDSYFWTINPEMLNRSIQPHQTQYKKEWLAIREIFRDRLTWMQLPLCYAEPGEYGYEIKDYGEAMTALTDAVFYARHPELNGRRSEQMKPTSFKSGTQSIRAFHLAHVRGERSHYLFN
jgi:hypothetical protein